MRGKYEAPRKKSRRKPWVTVLTVLLVLLLALVGLVVWAFLPEWTGQVEPSAPEQTQQTQLPVEPEQSESAAVQPEEAETEVPMEEEAWLFAVDANLVVKEIGSYSGAYVEDGSDEPVEDVMYILVKNVGAQSLQYAKLTLTGAAGEAVFEMTTLMPGESMLVLEKNRKTYAVGDGYSAVHSDNLAYFQTEPQRYEEQLWIQPLEGGLNVKNISDEAIEGNIMIYFKNYEGGMYIGGITYTGTVKDGLEAGEIRQLMSSHFTQSKTAVVFVNIG